MEENIFAYDEFEILEDSLRALENTLDKINEKFDNKDITDSIIDQMNRDSEI